MAATHSCGGGDVTKELKLLVGVVSMPFYSSDHLRVGIYLYIPFITVLHGNQLESYYSVDCKKNYRPPRFACTNIIPLSLCTHPARRSYLHRITSIVTSSAHSHQERRSSQSVRKMKASPPAQGGKSNTLPQGSCIRT